jgi:hypothetical protein
MKRQVWRLFYRLPSDERRRAMTLGRFPELGLADARTAARAALRLAGRGQDPKAKRADPVRTNLLLVNETTFDLAQYASCLTGQASSALASKFPPRKRSPTPLAPLATVGPFRWRSCESMQAIANQDHAAIAGKVLGQDSRKLWPASEVLACRIDASPRRRAPWSDRRARLKSSPPWRNRIPAH